MPDRTEWRHSCPDGFHGHDDPLLDRAPATAPPFDAVLARAQAVADVLAARATTTDQADHVPAENFTALAEAGLLGLTVPPQFGGHGAPGPILRRYSEIMAAACGVTTFVQTQHLSAASQIAASANDALKAETLPALATGQIRCGVAFSHVRRPGPPLLRVEPVADGYRFEGVAPWFTGWGTMQCAVIAGTLPSGDYLFAYTPVLDHPQISASAPLRLAAMNASMTVTLTCHRLVIPRERVVKIITPREMAASDAASFLRNTAPPLGVARA
ncbi:MAG: acyl-CoA/acyl-ACP dehydrogenase, partial [Dehalococcoidia bacterium]|nr:acyl-CoA/acyl-ACP dehydrogenase [Dehalococcoidia bacterium]